MAAIFPNRRVSAELDDEEFVIGEINRLGCGGVTGEIGMLLVNPPGLSKIARDLERNDGGVPLELKSDEGDGMLQEV